VIRARQPERIVYESVRDLDNGVASVGDWSINAAEQIEAAYRLVAKEKRGKGE
jgi:hypothetical protein